MLHFGGKIALANAALRFGAGGPAQGPWPCSVTLATHTDQFAETSLGMLFIVVTESNLSAQVGT